MRSMLMRACAFAGAAGAVAADDACGAVAQAPTVAIVSPLANATTFDVAEPVPVWAAFVDPDRIDTHTCSIAWGDGSSSAGVVVEVRGAGACRGAHT